MNVFIMWAGERSHAIARDLKGFLEFVVRGPKYFISDDIEGGKLWRVVLSEQLETSGFGIACLTPENLKNQWIHFEAGALSKAVGQSNVIPFLVGAKTSDVDGPLSDFQMISCDETGVRKLVSLLTLQAPGTLEAVVGESFGYVWPKFKQKLSKTLKTERSGETAESVRSDPEIMQEILDRVRSIESKSNHKPENWSMRDEKEYRSQIQRYLEGGLGRDDIVRRLIVRGAQLEWVESEIKRQIGRQVNPPELT